MRNVIKPLLHARNKRSAHSKSSRKIRDQVLKLYLTNLAPSPINAALQLGSYHAAKAEVTRIHSSDLNVRNSPETPNRIVSKAVPWTLNPEDPRIELPGYSFSTIRLQRGRTMLVGREIWFVSFCDWVNCDFHAGMVTAVG